MLATPRLYLLAQTPDRGLSLAPRNRPRFSALGGWSVASTDSRRASEMLLIHQVGSVRVGEVARYTLTYTPSSDRILPTPNELYVKVRNSSAIPLRAAYLRGPYTLHVSCYPTSFDPNCKFEDHEIEGAPQFEPNLKAGGAWDATIPVPERVRSAPAPRVRDSSSNPPPNASITWIIEISSQVIFSSSAAVQFEVTVGRDEKSTELGAGNVADLPPPGQLAEICKRQRESIKKAPLGKIGGVYSDSIKLKVDDTSSLWSTPRFPSLDEKQDIRALEQKQTASSRRGSSPRNSSTTGASSEDRPRSAAKRKKVHFVVLSHGLHSNLGADLLYLKESIDAAAKQAKEDAKRDRASSRKASTNYSQGGQDSKTSPGGHDNVHDDGYDGDDNDDDDDDDELVIVRGFPGNAVRTERGIQYLGKRLAKYVLLVTYPDQPYLPVKNPRNTSLSRAFGFHKQGDPSELVSHRGSTIHRQEPKNKNYAYNITSISFIGHSLGGLVQTYAIAYIQKHSPGFFEHIKPVNFVALATPFLGLSNENPLYVKFALDFGLVGRTGQDLGLAWSAPSKVRSGWGAMIGGLGTDTRKSQREPDPGSKPLLRILPTGPAHQVLRKFRNRTVYSNVVNDGIVPLRTSCLLFLDWRGLNRVEKAQRENGLVGTMAEWGWAELTGANSRLPRTASDAVKDEREDDSNNNTPPQSASPSPAERSPRRLPAQSRSLQLSTTAETSTTVSRFTTARDNSTPATPSTTSSPLNNFLSIFRSQTKTSKTTKMINRSQTLRAADSAEDLHTPQANSTGGLTPNPGHTRGDSLYNDDPLLAPPKTTIFESAGDLLNPPLPNSEFILDPSSRSRAIFHDRVYHPDDVPEPQPGKQRTLFSTTSNTFSNRNHSNENTSSEPASAKLSGSKGGEEPPQPSGQPQGSSGLKVEEKIARAYHHGLSWRKVLVSLQPDAHNNIIVRRKFANAYGWPVIKHIVDTHFGYSYAAQTADTLEKGTERAVAPTTSRTDIPDEVKGQQDAPARPSTAAGDDFPSTPPVDCDDEGDDKVPEMTFSQTSQTLGRATGADSNFIGDEDIRRSSESPSRASSSLSRISRQDSARWTDRYFDEDGDTDEEEYMRFDEDGRRRLSSASAPQLDVQNVDTLAKNSHPDGTFLSDELTRSPVGVGESADKGVSLSSLVGGRKVVSKESS